MRKIFSLLVAALMCAGAMAATYTVAGSQEVLGSNWSETDTNNDMTLVGEVYQLVKENVTLGASTYEYKVVKDHNWNNGSNAWPSSNAKLTIAEDGVYDVTFTFNESTKAVNAVAEKKGSAVVEKHYLVVGEESVVNGAGWNNDNAANLMTSTDEGLTYKLTIENLTLQAKDYEYKIVEKGTWTAYYDNGEGGNAKFTISETAVYTIEYVFTVANSTCVVTATKTGGAEPIETNYYLVGSKHGWEPADANKLTATATEGEFSITTTLAVGDQIKVLGVQGAVQTWYPDGMGTDYTVDAAHAGEKTIYFRPAGNDEWETFHQGGFIFIEENESIEPIVVKDLKLVPGVWTVDGAKLAVWAWGAEAPGAWSAFNGEGDTLVAKIMEKADSVIFVRFSDKVVEPAWVDSLIWNKTADQEIDECGLFFVNNWDIYSWCEPAQEEVEWKEIAFTEVAAKGTLNGKIFKAENSEFALTITDTDDKFEIDSNTARFGEAEAYVSYTHRLKTGGKSSSKNNITLTIPADGQLRIAARTGSNSATDRNLILAQGIDTLYNAVVKESDAIVVNEQSSDGPKEVNVYPYIVVDVKAGELAVTYPVGSLNFYAFAFAGEETKPEPVLANGYYLISDPWTVESLTETALFTANPGAEGEYMLSTTLVLNQEIKVVEVENDAVKTWFPDGMDNAYKVDSAHVGTTIIYFRPDGQGGEGWYNGFFFVTPNEGTAIDRVQGQSQSTKVLREGQLLIIRDGKTYNVIGVRVR